MSACVVDNSVCVGAGRAHTVFYGWGSPALILGMLVSSVPDNTLCSIIMRHYLPLGMHVDKVFFPHLLPCLLIPFLPLSSSVFLLEVSVSSLLLVVLER